MPIKPYQSPLHLRDSRISALIIEEDLSDIESPDSTWFLPSNLLLSPSTQTKPITFPHAKSTSADAMAAMTALSSLPTETDTSRRNSITLSKIQTSGLKLEIVGKGTPPTMSFSNSIPHKRRNSEVYFHSPLSKTRTFSEFSSSRSTSPGDESPMFYLDGDDVESISSARGIPIPKKKQRRGCFVSDDGEDVSEEIKSLNSSRGRDERSNKKQKIDNDSAIEDCEEESQSESSESVSDSDLESVFDSMEEDEEEEDHDYDCLESWIQYAYAPSTTFETALITEVVRRRKSDEHFAFLTTNSDESALENAQFGESHRRSQWIKDMCRWYPAECGEGHVLPVNC